jgi:putative membrane-bound dehydrogenase-like protein
MAILPICLPLTKDSFAVPPRVTDDRYKLELIASDPQIVTPVGMAFDRKGRLLVVESNTHQRPKEYGGPASDRIRMLSDSDGDGKLDKWSTFADGFRFAMNLLVRDDGGVYIVERGRVILLRDTDDDGVADKQKVVLRLETAADYPHNGLSGIAQEGDGSLIIGLGENFGESYELISAGGVKLKGTGGQNGFFRMSIDGKQLERIACGVWNPFAICVVPGGRIFAVDNDPDSSPPCRLLHVVPGGDYGYLFQYGRAGTHPLQAWNGELPGTLPYVCGVGEAPTAIVPHAGGLWVTSWGDHRIERYELVPRGASCGAKRDVIVQGDENFRPTGMTVAPDGSLYFGDWVLRDYPVHGKGRVWRLTLPTDEIKASFPPRPDADLEASDIKTNVFALAKSDDPFVHARGVLRYSLHPEIGADSNSDSRIRLAALEGERLRQKQNPEELLRTALRDEAADVRLYAVRWIADDRVALLRDDVGKLLDGQQPNARNYLAVLAAVDWLDHEPSMRGTDFTDELLIRELKNESRTPQAHALALSLLKPDSTFLTIERLAEYLHNDYVPLRLEAVRSLAEQSNSNRFSLLAQVAQDKSQPIEIRAEAAVGIAAASDKTLIVLNKLVAGDDPVLKREAARALRLLDSRATASADTPPAADIESWQKLLATSGDAASGRRLFFSPVGPRCGMCHAYGGRGGNVGPDLTRIGSNTSRERIIASILQPSREIAPDYQPWSLVTSDGKSYTALRLPKAGDDGKENYIDSDGRVFTLASGEIEERHAADKSIMPDNLQSTLTIEDLRDLVTFLTTSP